MADKKIYNQDTWQGGISFGSRVGYDGSFFDCLGINFRRDPDKLTILNALKKDSGATVTDLVKWIVEYDGAFFFYGDTGILYRRLSDGTWTNQRDVTGSSGQGMAIFNSLNEYALWYAGSTKLGRATELTGTISFDDDFIVSNNLNIDQTDGATSYANTYSLGSSVDEGSTHKRAFTPAKKMCSGVKLFVSSVGTGTWTVKLHDSNNNEIATTSIASGSLTGSAFNTFSWSAPVELAVTGSYHLHVYSSNSTGTVGTTSSSDFSTAGYKTLFNALVSDNDFHPMLEFTNLLCIGNSNFLATLDDSEVYDPERLEFPKGERVRCLERIGGTLVIGTVKGTDLNQYDKSRLYFWDGVSPTYTDFVEIDGQVNAIRNAGNNLLYVFHGTEGHISIYGGDGGITFKRKLKDVEFGSTVEIFPQAVNTWEKLLYFGISGGTSEEATRCIYSYGKLDNDYPNALSKDYPISTGGLDTDVKIGAILGVSANKFFISWKDGASYGVDIIDTANQQKQAYYISTRIDGGAPYYKKYANTVSLRCDPLVNGSIEVLYKINNKGDFISMGKVSYSSDGEAVYKSFPFNPKTGEDADWYEVQFKVVLSTTVNNAKAPTLLNLSMEYKVNGEFQSETV